MISEKQFERQVKDAAKFFRWRRYHTFRSQWSPAGFPDEVLIRGHRMIFAELKTDDKKSQLSLEQREWLWDLAGCGRVEVYLWRPSWLPQILEVLR